MAQRSAPSNLPGAPPVSFKTVPGRNRTQKWQQAKTQNYDGDDWASYDQYEEYAGDDGREGTSQGPSHFDTRQQQSQQAPPPPQSLYGQQGVPHRTHSFDTGDDGGRQFSGALPSVGPLQPRQTGRPRDFTNPESVPPPLSMRGSGSPAPKSSFAGPASAGPAFTGPAFPGPSSFGSKAAVAPMMRAETFPARKSSLSLGESVPAPATAVPASEVDTLQGQNRGVVNKPAAEKPLPFIRPSDIYKRMAEEKERERVAREAEEKAKASADLNGRSVTNGGERNVDGEGSIIREGLAPSTLPSMEQTKPALEPTADHAPSQLQRQAGEQQQQTPSPAQLAPQSELHETMDRVFNAPILSPTTGVASLPSTYGNAPNPSLTNPSPVIDLHSKSPSSFGSVVHRAFDRSTQNDDNDEDERGSVRPNPTSGIKSVVPSTNTDAAANVNAMASEVTRSNTDSTASISPIMSRVPSVAIPQQRGQNDGELLQGSGQDHGVPTIDEEDVPSIHQSRDFNPIRDENQHSHSGALQQQQQQQHQEQNQQYDQQPQHQIPRKPSPSHSRNSSAEVPGTQPLASSSPFRRSLQPLPHSQENSPARTPVVEDVIIETERRGKRISEPRVAEMGVVHERERLREGMREGDIDASRALDQEAVKQTGVQAPPAHDEAREVGDEPSSHVGSGSLSAAALLAGAGIGTTAAAATGSQNLPAIQTTRARSGTDYSAREADMAHSINASPSHPLSSPSAEPPDALAAEQRANQQEFLRTHNEPQQQESSMPTPPVALSPITTNTSLTAAGGSNGSNGSGVKSSATGSGGESPAKGRVRNLAERYNGIDDGARRPSQTSVTGVSAKSSWSNFGAGAEEENLPAAAGVKRAGTGLVGPTEGGDGAADERDVEAKEATPARPPILSVESFAPRLPGGWISAAPTPASEEPPPRAVLESTEHDKQHVADETQHSTSPSSPPLTPRPHSGAAGTDLAEEPMDLTPTTRKSPLEEKPTPNFAPDARLTSATSPSSAQSSTFSQVKSAGTALGAALLASAGLASQGRDSAGTAKEKAISGNRQEGDSARSHAPLRDLITHQKSPLPLVQREGSEVTNAPTSMASSIPPTPPAKDTPTELSPAMSQTYVNENSAGSSTSGYFPSPVAPLRTGFGRSEINHPDPSAHTTTVREMESERLTSEIERTLEPGEVDSKKAVTEVSMQDELHAPNIERHTDKEEKALPAVATVDVLRQTGGPGLLGQRYSWEDREASEPFTVIEKVPEPELKDKAHEPRSPEIKPEMPYERPKERGLHLMNADSEEDRILSPQDSTPTTAPAFAGDPALTQHGLTEELPSGARHAVSPDISPISNDTLAFPSMEQRAAGVHDSPDTHHSPPSPISDDRTRASVESEPRLPSYRTTANDPFTIASLLPSTVMSAPQPLEKDLSSPLISPHRQSSLPPGPTATASAGARIPPFREILAIKSAPERIFTYNTTRQTFAQMDTGLATWVNGMLAQHPEHADVSTAASSALQSSFGVGGPFRHRASPSVSKFAKQFTERRTSSIGGEGELSGPPRTPVKDGAANPTGAEARIDMERMQQRGKDLMKSAGALGGKVQGGAKGLFSKGKNRFGLKRDSGGADGKAPTPPPPSIISSIPPVPPLPPSTTQASTLPAHVASRDSTNSSLTFTTSRPQSYNSSSPALSQLTLSSITQRPLSQILSPLREHPTPANPTSRSMLMSRENDPRPQSLITTNPDQLRNDDGENRSAGRSAFDQAFMIARARTEAWEEPDAVPSGMGKAAVIGHDDAGGDDRTPTRLGVLPSPVVETFSMLEQSSPEAAISPTRTVTSSAEVSRSPAKAGPSTDNVSGPQAANSAYNSAIGRSETRESDRMTDTTSETLPPSQPQRSHEQCEVGARASLPSQRRSQPSSPRSPPPIFLRRSDTGNNEDDEDDIEISTPTGPKALASQVTLPLYVKQEEADDRYGSTMLPVRDQAIPASSITASAVRGTISQPPIGQGSAFQFPQALPGAESATADAWEKTSQVSAEEQVVDASNGDAGERVRPSSSRRSSVSSIGIPDTVIAKRNAYDSAQSVSAAQPATPRQGTVAIGEAGSNLALPPRNMEGNAVIQPALPRDARGGDEWTGSPSDTQRTTSASVPLVDQQRFMNRMYRGGGPPTERPMSYAPLSLDASGAPLQDRIDTLADLPGSFKQQQQQQQQQNRTSRNSFSDRRPNEYDESHPSREASVPILSRQISENNARNTPSVRRLSGLFRSPKSPPGNRPDVPTIPAPHALQGNFGLEDLSITGADSIASEMAPVDPYSPSKRSSGLWSTFKRSPSASSREFHREDAATPLQTRSNLALSPASFAVDATRENNSTPRPNTLQKKPQRAASVATGAVAPQDPKKKRFSGLGSIFGRSGTLGHQAAGGRKLTKAPQSGREGSSARQIAKSYEDFEAAQQTPQIPDWTGTRQSPSYLQPAAVSAYQEQTLGAQASPVSPPQQGWYGPKSPDRAAATANPYPPNQSLPSPPQQEHFAPFRKLHSDSFQRGLQYALIPEAFRPTEAAYGHVSPPVGPPSPSDERRERGLASVLLPPPASPAPTTMTSARTGPTLPTEQPLWNQRDGRGRYALPITPASNVEAEDHYTRPRPDGGLGSPVGEGQEYGRAIAFPPPRQSSLPVSQFAPERARQQDLHQQQLQRQFVTPVPLPERNRRFYAQSTPLSSEPGVSGQSSPTVNSYGRGGEGGRNGVWAGAPMSQQASPLSYSSRKGEDLSNGGQEEQMRMGMRGVNWPGQEWRPA